MKFCLIDNYDSFTYNIEHLLLSFGATVDVVRNDAASVDELARGGYDAFVIGPGPSNPTNAGISVELIKKFHTEKPILGVCLGLQCIGAAFGARIVQSDLIKHGKTSLVEHNGQSVFKGLANSYPVMRYHSLVIAPDTLPDELEVTAWADEGSERVIMAVSHRDYPLIGIQFHPESIFTEQGRELMQNFLDQIG